jgi:hypothetical protein
MDKLDSSVNAGREITSLLKGLSSLQSTNPLIFQGELKRYLNILCLLLQPSAYEVRIAELSADLLQAALNTWQYRQGDVDNSEACKASFLEFINE